MIQSHKTIIETKNVEKTFHVSDKDVTVLADVSIKINTGDFVIIYGPSGSGKSTLLHVLLGLEPPTKGSVTFYNTDLYTHTTEDYRTDVRKKYIGMVYQQANWIKALNVVENVAFQLEMLGMEEAAAIAQARGFLEKFDMAQWADYLPTELSGGQQQRVAMARALIHDPILLVADEPTGNLDYKSGQVIMDMLTELNKKSSKTIVMVTHDLAYLHYATKAVHIFDGKVKEILSGKETQKYMALAKLREE